MSILCKKCNKLLNEDERPCSFCGSPGRIYKVECKPAIYRLIFGPMKWKHKRPGTGVIMEGINRPFKKSGDPKFSEGVNEIYWKDKIKKMWHQIVSDNRTGEVVHEEHQTFEEKNKEKQE